MLGKWLHKHRRAHSLTRQRAAELSSVSLSQLWRIETREEGTMETYERACAALGLEFYGIVSGPSLGAQMKAERLRKALSLRAVAELSGVSVNAIRRCEEDAGTLATAMKVLHVLAPQMRPQTRTLRVLPIRRRDVRLTPPDFVEKVLRVIGPITLDPCACPGSFVESASEHSFYESDDGLSRSWAVRSTSGGGTNIFANPPYSGWGAWVRKAHREWRDGAVDCVALLLPVRTGNAAFIELGDQALTLFLKQRLRFYSLDRLELPVHAPFASMLMFFGNDLDAIERRAREVWEGRFISPSVKPQSSEPERERLPSR